MIIISSNCFPAFFANWNYTTGPGARRKHVFDQEISYSFVKQNIQHVKILV